MAAFATVPAQDLAGSAGDHPLLSRFAGSVMVEHDVKEFDAAFLPAGRRIANQGGRFAFETGLGLEGKVTRIAYNYPQERSLLEVMRNYEAALAKAGIRPVFACDGKGCGANFGS